MVNEAERHGKVFISAQQLADFTRDFHITTSQSKKRIEGLTQILNELKDYYGRMASYHKARETAFMGQLNSYGRKYKDLDEFKKEVADLVNTGLFNFSSKALDGLKAKFGGGSEITQEQLDKVMEKYISSGVWKDDYSKIFEQKARESTYNAIKSLIAIGRIGTLKFQSNKGIGNFQKIQEASLKKIVKENTKKSFIEVAQKVLGGKSTYSSDLRKGLQIVNLNIFSEENTAKISFQAVMKEEKDIDKSKGIQEYPYFNLVGQERDDAINKKGQWKDIWNQFKKYLQNFIPGQCEGVFDTIMENMGPKSFCENNWMRIVGVFGELTWLLILKTLLPSMNVTYTANMQDINNKLSGTDILTDFVLGKVQTGFQIKNFRGHQNGNIAATYFWLKGDPKPLENYKVSNGLPIEKLQDYYIANVFNVRSKWRSYGPQTKGKTKKVKFGTEMQNMYEKMRAALDKKQDIMRYMARLTALSDFNNLATLRSQIQIEKDKTQPYSNDFFVIGNNIVEASSIFIALGKRVTFLINDLNQGIERPNQHWSFSDKISYNGPTYSSGAAQKMWQKYHQQPGNEGFITNYYDINSTSFVPDSWTRESVLNKLYLSLQMKFTLEEIDSKDIISIQ